MKLLAIDTSAHMSSVCIYDANERVVLSEDCQNIGRGHAEVLMGQIANCLRLAGQEYRDISRIAVAAGPGSFTGIRVGMAVARGLKLGLGIPALGVSCLDACRLTAEKAGHCRHVLCVMDARRGQVLALHPGWEKPRLISMEDAITAAENLAIDLCGSAAPAIAQKVGYPAKVVHDLAAMPIVSYCELAAQAEPANEPPEPLYARSADAKPQHGFALPRSVEQAKAEG